MFALVLFASSSLARVENELRCAGIGAGCGGGGECCSGNCNGGACSPVLGCDSNIGDPCNGDGDCCSGNCAETWHGASHAMRCLPVAEAKRLKDQAPSCSEFCASGGHGSYGVIIGTSPSCDGSCNDCGGYCQVGAVGEFSDYGSGCWSGEKVCCCSKSNDEQAVIPTVRAHLRLNAEAKRLKDLSCGGINAACTVGQECCSARCDDAHRCRPTEEEEQKLRLQFVNALKRHRPHPPTLTCGGTNAACTAPQECCSSRCDSAHRCRPTEEEEFALAALRREGKLTCGGTNAFCTAPQECCSARCDSAHRCRPTVEEELEETKLTCGGTNAFCTAPQECCSARCDSAHRCRPTFEEEARLLEEGEALSKLRREGKLSCGGINSSCTFNEECCSAQCDAIHRCRPTEEVELTCGEINASCTVNQECCSARCDSAHRCRPVGE